MDYIKRLENEISGYKNNLLGYYNKNNEYTINPEIISNLIQEPKNIESMSKEKIECSCYISGFGNINFEILITTKEDCCFTDLYIVEEVNKINGYVKQVERTLIAKYESKVDREYFKKVLYAFNLYSDATEMEEPNLEDVHKSYIYARKNFNEKMFLEERSNYNKAIKTVVDAQLNHLKKNKNPFTKEVLNSFKKYEKELSKEYLKVGKTLDDFAVYELLNLCVNNAILNNPDFKVYLDKYNADIAISAENALKLIKEYNEKYIADYKKKQDIMLSQNLLKIISNKDKIKNSESTKEDNVLEFGNLKYNGLYEVNSLEQLFALNSKDFAKYIKLKAEQDKYIERMYENISFDGESLFEDIIDMCLDVVNQFDVLDVIPDSVEEFKASFGIEEHEVNDSERILNGTLDPQFNKPNNYLNDSKNTTETFITENPNPFPNVQSSGGYNNNFEYDGPSNNA